jgi:NitT/TauT family transport system substrate-binding protein
MKGPASCVIFLPFLVTAFATPSFMASRRLRLALDWTPNTNHTGFYVALAQGDYQAAGIDLEIITPEGDHYATTPAKKLELGHVDLAIAPSESVISYQTKSQPAPLRAIAAVLARDASAIAAPASRRIRYPRQLDGRIYASYAARFEDHIVRTMVKNDGGLGDLWVVYPERLSLWQLIEEDQADATWIFLPWEGVEAEMRQIPLSLFALSDYGIPYGYSPVLLAHEAMIADQQELLQDFLQVTQAGFHYAEAEPEAAADLLIATAAHPTLANREFVVRSQQEVAAYYRKDLPWGQMEGKVWADFVKWLVAEAILTDGKGDVLSFLDPEQLYTNSLLPRG